MTPTPSLAADPALEQLLFVLALFKGAITVGVLLLVRWRQRHPMGTRRRVAYVTSATAMCVATGLLLARTALSGVPFLFDGGLIAIVLLAITDTPMLRALGERYPNRAAVRVRPKLARRMASIEAMLRASSHTLRRQRR